MLWVRQSTPLRRAAPTSDAARWLREQVRRYAIPRHAGAEERANRHTADRLAQQLESMGYAVQEQGPHRNVVALPRDAGHHPLTLVCAHYDSVPRSPGADDNASALAVMLGVARTRPARTAFVAFNREEDGMVGSTDFVAWLGRAGAPVFDRVHVLEMVGYSDPRPGTQRLPPAIPRFLLPRDTGDFIAFVGDRSSRAFVRRCIGLFRDQRVLPSEGIAAPSSIPGISWSDHWSYSRAGYPAVMVTDTAPFRNPNYHEPTDTADTLDYERMARLATGLEEVVWELARGD